MNHHRTQRTAWHGAALALATTFAFGLTSCAPANTNPIPQEETTREGSEFVPALSTAEKAELAQFREPQLDAAAASAILARYGHLDPNHEIPDQLLAKAVLYYDTNSAHVTNKSYLSIVDFSKNSSEARFFIVDMASGQVVRFHVAHGKGSDPDNDGYATVFSNRSNSEMSSVGFYKTAETYNGKHGYSLRLDGLSSTNSNVRSRAIVIHGASYVYDQNKKAGRSWGCFALPMNDKDKIIAMLKQGSIIYASTED